MKTFNLVLIALFAAFTISSCSDDDSWKYGDKQKLANTTWQAGSPPHGGKAVIRSLGH